MAKELRVVVLYDAYKELLTEKQRDALEMYYFSDLSLGEIAEETGVTRQAAFNTIKGGEAKLSEFESALGLVGKRERAEMLIDKLLPLLKNDEDSLVLARELAEELKELIRGI